MITTAIAWLFVAALALLLAVALVALWVAERDSRNDRREIRDLTAERDVARDTVRELLDAQRAGYRYPRPQPMPPPGDALTAEFTQIVERHRWPEGPK